MHINHNQIDWQKSTIWKEQMIYVGVSKNNGTPKWMVQIMENPMNKWMIWGVKTPYFWFNTDVIYPHKSIQGYTQHSPMTFWMSLQLDRWESGRPTGCQWRTRCTSRFKSQRPQGGQQLMGFGQKVSIFVCFMQALVSFLCLEWKLFGTFC